MTEQMAIIELQQNIDLPFGGSVSDEASEIAIKALEEIQQYRALGTVEEFKALKEKKPKKQKNNKVIYTHDSYAYCPHCKHSIETLFISHCTVCEGELDWK